MGLASSPLLPLRLCPAGRLQTQWPRADQEKTAPESPPRPISGHSGAQTKLPVPLVHVPPSPFPPAVLLLLSRRRTAAALQSPSLPRRSSASGHSSLAAAEADTASARRLFAPPSPLLSPAPSRSGSRGRARPAADAAPVAHAEPRRRLSPGWSNAGGRRSGLGCETPPAFSLPSSDFFLFLPLSLLLPAAEKGKVGHSSRGRDAQEPVGRER